MTSSKLTRYTPTFPEETIPEEGDETDSSDEGHINRKSRRPPTKRPRISVVSEVNPSPRVSAFEPPQPSLLKKFVDSDSETSVFTKDVVQRISGIVMLIIIIILLVVIIYLATKPSNQLCNDAESDNSTLHDNETARAFNDTVT